MRFSAPTDAGRCQDLAAHLRIPVVLPDAQIHRRIAVHYLWLPDAGAPAIHGAVVEVLQEIAGAGFRNFAMIHGERAGSLWFTELAIQSPTPRNHHG